MSKLSSRPSGVNHKVYQSNSLIESSYSLTVNEKRLVLYAASLLDSRKAAPKDGLVSIKAESFGALFGMETRHAYGVLEECVDRLFDRQIRRFEKGVEVESIRWVYRKQYREGEGVADVYFSPTVLPHLTLLHREFTGFQIKNVANLSSFNSFRIYELMAQYKSFGEREFEVDRLRQLLQMEDKYPKVADFRKYVLEHSIKEVNQHTDLTLRLEPRRKGRSITAFKFHIEEADQLPLEM